MEKPPAAAGAAPKPTAPTPDASMLPGAATPGAASGIPKPELPTLHKDTTCLVIIGMAGSGKTTFVQRLHAHLHAAQASQLVINLDPAVLKLPYGANVDIRDSINYKQVMKQYGLGPNGAILTSLNLFATCFDQVLSIVERRAPTTRYVLVDTPGQIEVFNWSASGAIMLEALAAVMPVVLVYVCDVPRAAAPATFMANMLYACSLLYKSRLPVVLALNKSDVLDPAFALEWLRDYPAFQSALDAADASGSASYSGSLTRSMALALDEFYAQLPAVPVSAYTGAGVAELLTAAATARQHYLDEYRPHLERRLARQHARAQKRAAKQMDALQRDLDASRGQRTVLKAPARPKRPPRPPGPAGARDSDDSASEDEDEDEDDEGEDVLLSDEEDDDDDAEGDEDADDDEHAPADEDEDENERLDYEALKSYLQRQ